MTLEKRVGVVCQHDAERIDANQHHQRRKIKPAHLWQRSANRPIDRLNQAVQAIPYLCHQLLTQVEHLKIDEPAHDDMRDDDEPHDVEKQNKDCIGGPFILQLSNR